MLENPVDLNTLEQGRLFLWSSAPTAEGTVPNTYHYSGQPFENVEVPFPKLTEYCNPITANDVFSEYRKDVKDWSLREIFDNDSKGNHFLLKSHRIDAPAGFYFCDPSDLTVIESWENPSAELPPLFPAGEWEVTIKGAMMSSFTRTHPYQTTEGDILYINEIFDYLPYATTCWVLKPGVEFTNISSEPVGRITLNYRSSGIFPAENARKFSWNSFLDERDSFINSKEYAARVGQHGIYTEAIENDVRHNIYELFDSNGENAGFVCSYTNSFDSSNTVEGLFWQEAECGFDELSDSLEEKFEGKLTFAKRLSYREDSNCAYGTFADGSLFYFYPNVKMQYTLRVGHVDHDYRAQIEKMYREQGITRNGIPYVPEWDDNYPDRKIRESVDSRINCGEDTLQDIFEMLVNNLQDVPVENSLFL